MEAVLPLKKQPDNNFIRSMCLTLAKSCREWAIILPSWLCSVLFCGFWAYEGCGMSNVSRGWSIVLQIGGHMSRACEDRITAH